MAGYKLGDSCKCGARFFVGGPELGELEGPHRRWVRRHSKCAASGEPVSDRGTAERSRRDGEDTVLVGFRGSVQ